MNPLTYLRVQAALLGPGVLAWAFSPVIPGPMTWVFFSLGVISVLVSFVQMGLMTRMLWINRTKKSVPKQWNEDQLP